VNEYDCICVCIGDLRGVDIFKIRLPIDCSLAAGDGAGSQGGLDDWGGGCGEK